MKVILLEDVKALGKKGQIVKQTKRRSQKKYMKQHRHLQRISRQKKSSLH